MSTTDVEISLPSLRLNFFALKNQEFSFSVYRRACISPDEEHPEADVYKYSLPVQTDGEERKDYWISFIVRPDFELFDCTPDSNRRLTVRYLCYLLAQSVQTNLKPNDYDLEEVKFRQGLDVIIAHHAKGTERIWIEPSYLAPTCKFGFLVDFHFCKNEGVSFDMWYAPFWKRIL